MADGIAYELLRVRTRDGDETTVYLTRHQLARTQVSIVCFDEPTRLDHWCAANGRPEAIVAGFFLRDPYRPLGEVRIGGATIAHEPVGDARSSRSPAQSPVLEPRPAGARVAACGHGAPV